MHTIKPLFCALALVLLGFGLGCGNGGQGTDGECDTGCFLAGECQGGAELNACGTGGSACEVCENGQTCVDGQCAVPTCLECDGCCDENGECQPGTFENACGLAGVSCQECPGECEEGACAQPCGPENCLGCCDASGLCRYCTGDVCPNGEQDDSTCGYQGQACEQCELSEECSPIYSEGGDNGAIVVAGSCLSTDCSGCTEGCCLQVVGGGVLCDPGDGTMGCGEPGASCDICSQSEQCVEQTCLANSDVAFQLVLLSAEVPDKPEGATLGFDTFSAPDVRVVVRVQTDPESVADPVDGPDNTRQPSFGDEPVITRTRAEFQQGLFFDFIDRDSPDDDDDMATIPGAAYQPADGAFVDSQLLILTVGDYTIRFRFDVVQP